MKASFYEVDITPPIGGYMWGQYVKVIAEDVADRLHAKALVVEDGGNIAAMVAIDACVLPPELHDIVTKRIYEYTGISPDCVSINATHTHKGFPIIDSPELKCYGDASYKDVCYRLIADAVILAYKRLDDEEVEVSYGTGIAKEVGYIRDAELDDGTYVTQLRGRKNIVRFLGGIDESVNVLTFSKGGKKIGSIVNYSCHLDSVGARRAYSADYAGVVSKILKEKYGNDFVCLFLTGACGNVGHTNPDENIPKSNYLGMGAIVGEEAIRVIENSEPVHGTVSVCKELVKIEKRELDDDAMDRYIDRETGKLKLDLFFLKNYLMYKNTNEGTHAELYFQVIKIGDVAIALLPGEIYAAIGLAIKEKSPYKRTIIAELSNSYCGYIPLKELYGDNCMLYESMACHHSCLREDASDIVEEKALELLNRV